MRLWSIHPSYLDARGLVALWREGLLGLAVLRGRTRGYRHHPQLERFRGATDPVLAMRCYLWHVYQEATARGYRFNGRKIGTIGTACVVGPTGAAAAAGAAAAVANRPRLKVTGGQLSFELEHLRNKLRQRDPTRYRSLRTIDRPRPHPMFVKAAGGVESWERASARSEPRSEPRPKPGSKLRSRR